MHPLGIVLPVAGLLQAAGALTRSRIFQALPHFQRSERLFVRETSIMLRAVVGIIAAVGGVLIMIGVIVLPASK